MEQLIEALQIFLKYSNEDYPTGCEHDVLYIYVDPDVVTEEDKQRLEELGFSPADFGGAFESTKYGSA